MISLMEPNHQFRGIESFQELSRRFVSLFSRFLPGADLATAHFEFLSGPSSPDIQKKASFCRKKERRSATARSRSDLSRSDLFLYASGHDPFSAPVVLSSTPIAGERLPAIQSAICAMHSSSVVCAVESGASSSIRFNNNERSVAVTPAFANVCETLPKCGLICNSGGQNLTLDSRADWPESTSGGHCRSRSRTSRVGR